MLVSCKKSFFIRSEILSPKVKMYQNLKPEKIHASVKVHAGVSFTSDMCNQPLRVVKTTPPSPAKNMV